MAFLFKPKKKKEESKEDKPPTPPQPEGLESTQQKKEESSSQKLLSSEDKKDLQTDSQEKSDTNLQENVKVSNNLDIENELKELESKLMSGFEAQDTKEQESEPFSGLLKETKNETVENKPLSQIDKTISSDSIILYSQKENSHFIKETDLQWLFEQINKILEINQYLKTYSEEIKSLVSQNKANVEELAKNANFMFNKSITCDAIIRGENNG
ncbi:MAG: hypothetical protein PWP03_443 [Candidatus Woesearchaeota archaeon]|nr:hypothetical protein [Candidatus Woesearchaeota archaeon]